MSEVIETRTAKMWMGADGIIRVHFLGIDEATLAEAQEYLVAFKQLAGDRKRPMLGVMGEVRSAPRPIREYLIREGPRYQSAVALLVKSPMSRIIANFFLGLNKPAIPLRLFNNEAEAIEWLKGFL